MSLKTNNPVFEKVLYSEKQSHICFIQRLAHLEHPWHFHPDVELVLITKGYGKRFVGDNISFFKEGDLVLLGSNLPHVWINDKPFYSENPKLISESIVIQFNKDYFSPGKIEFPELSFLNNLLHLSQYGLSIEGKNNQKEIVSMIHSMTKLQGTSSLALLFSMLEEISKNNGLKQLSGSGFLDRMITPLNKRLNNVFEFVMQNYRYHISIEKAASVANMNKSSFCRYFKLQTGKTFVEFINELRTGYASKLLIDRNLSITQVCFESGFQSVSNFNKQFYIQYKLSPRDFRKKYSEIQQLA